MQLEDACRRFVTKSSTVMNGGLALQLSPIFRMYADDFGGEPGVVSFVRRYHEQRELILSTPEVRYAAFDWTLNQAPQQEFDEDMATSEEEYEA